MGGYVRVIASYEKVFPAVLDVWLAEDGAS